MSEASDKTIKIGVVADTAGFDKLKGLVRELRSELEKTAEVASKIGGGILGMSSRSGQFNAATASMGGSKAGTGSINVGAGVSDALAKSLRDNKDLLRGIANESKDAAKAMADAVKSGVDTQISKIGQLKAELKSLGADYSVLTRRRDDMIAGRLPFSEDAFNQVSSTQSRIGAAGKELMDLQKAQRGNYQRTGLDRFLGADKNGQIDVLGQLRGFLPAMGIATAFSLPSSMMGAYQGTQANEQLLRPFDARGIQARVGGAIGSMGNAIRHGDIGTQIATQMAVQDALRFADQGRGTNLGAILDGTSKEARLKQKELLFNNPAGWGKALVNPIGTGYDAARQGRQLRPEEFEDVRRYVDMMKQSDPEFFSNIGEFSGNVGGRIGAMRALNMGFNNRPNLALNGSGSMSVTAPGQGLNMAMTHLSKLRGRGFGDGEIMGMSSQIQGLGGRSMAGSEGLPLSMQAGGLYNAGALYGTANQYGDAGAFMSQLGSSGLDATAAGRLGSLTQGGMGDGGAPSSGLGYMGALSGLSGFQSGGEQVRSMGMMQAGAGGYARMQSGQTDALQGGVNVLASVRAGGGLDVYGMRALRGISQRQQADILRTGVVPQALRDRGITPDILRKYMNEQDRLGFARYVTGTSGGSTGMDQFVSSVRQAGGLRAAYSQALGLSGFTPGSSEAQELGRDFARRAGNVYEDTGQASSQQEGEGRARIELGMDSTLVPTPKRGGIGDPARGTAEMEFEKREAERLRILEEKLGTSDMNSKLKAMSKVANKDADVFHEFATKLNTDAGDFELALEGMTRKMKDIAKELSAIQTQIHDSTKTRPRGK